MSKKTRNISVGVGAVLVLFGLNLRRDLRDLAKELEWSPVVRGVLQCSVSSPGVIEAIRVKEIQSQVDEQIVRVLVKEGEAVKKGQQLMELTRINTKLEFDQKKNSLSESKSNYLEAKKELRVQKKLFKNHAVPKSQVEEAERSMKRAKATWDITKQEFEITKRKLESTHVRSPMNGVVLRIHNQSGARVSTGKPLITVGDTSQFLVRTKIDELDISQVHLGQNVEVKVDAFPNKAVRGKVSTIASQADREAFAKVEVLVQITDDDGIDLKHNLSGHVNILTERITDAIGIPIKSIQRKQKKKGWVLVRNRLNMIHEKEIELGRLAGDKIEVQSGLKPGAKVGTYLSSGQ